MKLKVGNRHVGVHLFLNFNKSKECVEGTTFNSFTDVMRQLVRAIWIAYRRVRPTKAVCLIFLMGNTVFCAGCPWAQVATGKFSTGGTDRMFASKSFRRHLFRGRHQGRRTVSSCVYGINHVWSARL